MFEIPDMLTHSAVGHLNLDNENPLKAVMPYFWTNFIWRRFEWFAISFNSNIIDTLWEWKSIKKSISQKKESASNKMKVYNMHMHIAC